MLWRWLKRTSLCHCSVWVLYLFDSLTPLDELGAVAPFAVFRICLAHALWVPAQTEQACSKQLAALDMQYKKDERVHALYSKRLPPS